MNTAISYTDLLGLLLPFVLLFFNKGYLCANRYLAGFLFFSYLFVLENYYLFYGQSISKIAFFTIAHPFFYLIGPFAYFYMRSILLDNCKLSKFDYLHFLLFAIALIGYVPYFFSSWEHKLLIAQNLVGEHWDITPFHVNKIIPHKANQILNVLLTYYYSISLWNLLRKYNKKVGNSILSTSQFKLIRNWFLVFASIFSIITINFTIAMSMLWIYEEKSMFLDHASITLLLAYIIYLAINVIILIFPSIMYGLPADVTFKHFGSGESIAFELSATLLKEVMLPCEESNESDVNCKYSPRLFTSDYILEIEANLKKYVDSRAYLHQEFKLNTISTESLIPAHHLTYFFNNIKGFSFSDWRNKLRIEHSKYLIQNGYADKMTLESISINCGFLSQNTFIRAFKNYTGITPSVYLKSLSLNLSLKSSFT